jgi:hypothetical protein
MKVFKRICQIEGQHRIQLRHKERSVELGASCPDSISGAQRSAATVLAAPARFAETGHPNYLDFDD